MKKLAITLFLFAALSTKGQNAKIDGQGNYIAIQQSKAKETKKTFTDSKGNVFPLFESINGKLYYLKTSKKGNQYKIYLKLEK